MRRSLMTLRRAFGAVAAGLVIGASPTALAEATKSLGIELNKLEPSGRSCLTYLVFRNQTGRAFAALQLELILFDRDGFILRRLTLDAAPIPVGKTSVKLFAIPGASCDGLGRLLINEVLTCAEAAGPLEGCMELLSPSSRLAVELLK